MILLPTSFGDWGYIVGGRVATCHTIVPLSALTAARNYDVPMILGSVLFGATLLAAANLVVDVLYTFLDPRVRLT